MLEKCTRAQLPENIATINYYFKFDPETCKLSLERGLQRQYCEGDERQLCVGKCFVSLTKWIHVTDY